MIVLAVILIYFAGVFHGPREAFHADRKLFEKRFGVHPVSFFGSQQGRLKYNGAGEFKSIWWKYFPFDFWHVSRWLENLAVAGAIWAMTGAWYFAAAYVAIIAAGGHLSYAILRKKNEK